MTSWQKAIKYAAMSFAMLLIVAIVGSIFTAFTSLSFIFSNKDALGEMKSYYIDGNIEDLYINISAADFTLKTGDEFHVESNNEYITVDDKNGKLSITESKRLFTSYSNDIRLELYIPDGTVFKSVEITTGAGTVKIDSLLTDILTLELGAGEVNIDTLLALKRASIDGGAGRLIISNGELCNLDLDMGIGELKLTAMLIGDCDVDQGVGSTELILLGTEDDYQIGIDKGIGDITLNGKNMSDDVTYGSGINKVDIDGGIGKIKIEFEKLKK